MDTRLAVCNKCCIFLQHNPVSVDQLRCIWGKRTQVWFSNALMLFLHFQIWEPKSSINSGISSPILSSNIASFLILPFFSFCTPVQHTLGLFFLTCISLTSLYIIYLSLCFDNFLNCTFYFSPFSLPMYLIYNLTYPLSLKKNDSILHF